MNRENILKRGNDSIAIGVMWGVGAVAHPCPICFLTTFGFLANGVREKMK